MYRDKINETVEQSIKVTVDSSHKTLTEHALALQEQNFRFALGMILERPVEALYQQAESTTVTGLRGAEDLLIPDYVMWDFGFPEEVSANSASRRRVARG